MRRWETRTSSWGWILGLYTVASFIEVMFWGQVGAFTPLFLPHLGIPPADVRTWVGIVTAISALVGISILATILWPLPALAGNLAVFTVLWALASGVMSGVFSVSFNVMAASAPEGVRARVMAFSFLPLMTGSAVGPALGVAVTGTSLMAIFPTGAICTAVGLLGLLVVRRQPLPEARSAVSP